MCSAWLLACGSTADRKRDDAAAMEALFSGRVAAIELELPDEAMAALAREPREYVKGSVALKLSGVKGARAIVARRQDVSIRFKGNRSMRGWRHKPAFKLRFSKAKQAEGAHREHLFGLRTLVLNNMVEDPTMLREALGYSVFRALSLPAPRTGYAEVRVNGEPFGLYAVIEPVEAPLLARSFERTDGPVYEGEYGCDLYDDDIPAMQLDSGEDPGRKHLRALVNAAKGPIGEALDGPRAVLHADHFFGFLAASALLGDFDGYRHAHNYLLYYDPGRQRFSILPWGLDRVLSKPIDVRDSHAVLAVRCFDDASCMRRYMSTLKQAMTIVHKLDLVAQAEAIRARIAPAVERDRKRPYKNDKREAKLAELRAYLEAMPARMEAATRCVKDDGERDEDGDGYGCIDCDDSDPNTHPGAVEACDGIDNDCSRVVDDDPRCACPEHVIEGRRFAVCDRALPWAQAAAFCEGLGGTLAHLTTKAEARRLSKIVKAVRDEHFWIGLHDREREGHPQWHGHGRKGLIYWDSSEPDDHACGQDCVALADGRHGKYRDLHCASPQPFVCGLPAKEMVPPQSDEKSGAKPALAK